MSHTKIRSRSQFVGAIFLLLFFAVIYRFYTLQVVEASWYQERAQAMYERERVLEPERGSIFDRNHNILAKEVKAYTVIAILDQNVPNHVKDPQATAEQLAPILDMSQEQLYQLLTQKDRQQVELRPGGWKIDAQKMEAIRELELEGITFREETRRYYPNHTFASHILGFVDLDGEARMGLELELDKYLRGEKGLVKYKQDLKGNRLISGTETVEYPKDGHDVYLTIDQRIQLFVEQALDEVYREYRPEKMTVIVSDPHTGQILAMSNRPSFDPNNYSSITNYWNDSVSYAFEPGSTFKVITFAAAIEEGIYNGHETFQSGSYAVPGKIIRDHNRQGWGTITFLEGMQKSSNVASVILGYERMKKEVFYHYIDRFGFGKLTGIDLPGEHPGYVIPLEEAKPVDLAAMTFGQGGLMVTPIQQIQAINVIANGGKLMKPYVIDSIYDPNSDKVVLQNKPTVVDPQVVSPQTAKQMRDILETVVTDGTGTNFHIDGYQVAGKTGTAQKAENGRYVRGKYIHSFVGFAPKDDPKLSVFVAIDSPQVDQYYLGGAAVAKVFKYVMENSLQYLNVTREIEEVSAADFEAEWPTVGDYRRLFVENGRKKGEQDGFDVHILGQGNEITEQYPTPGTPMPEGSRLYLIAGEVRHVETPDMTGWSLKEVLDWASVTRMKVRAEGHGYVTAQNVSPGVRLRPGSELQVTLEPKFDGR
ncbi:penicillin-binding protein 2B [Caldalkalibacillus thermarum]|uniref:penicillin-binding transpeptidase domain-containing protein n=1 Tax=Caldalkalibacillus thermarum TaxID=296745 RepID=UPI001664BA85|nr:PASTA domain-containing penicillin-binding protein [Caldalkalibacillus thermarum]GGK15645.1 penicillin-binding protein 2B [Caldalkalibacillus thermarum]